MLKKHRKIWINKKETEVDLKKFQKNARRLLTVCISLGPVYIKLGQWLSTRSDILPQPYMKELEKLQDDVPAEPFEKVKPTIEKEIGDIKQKFDSLDTNAISGASIGQVYLAQINGKKVVVKVKRPGIEKMVDKEIEVLKKILPVGLKFVDPNLGFSAKSMLAQFIETIHEEMDYNLELANLKRIKRNLSGNNQVITPSVFDDYSSKNVITMEYLPGIKITNIEALDKKGLDRHKLIVDVNKIFFTMLLRDSIFHADPHPGNISVSEDGKLILYDYGMVGRLDDKTRMRLVRLYLALIEKDPPRTVEAMNKLGMLTPDFNRPVIEKAIDITIKSMHGQEPDDMEVKAFLDQANKTMGKFPFLLPKELSLYIRMTSIIEGIYKTHKLKFMFVKVMREILEEENLINEAYIEELKYSFDRFAKSIDETISIAPDLRKFLDEKNSLEALTKKQKSNILLPGSIFSAAVFVGSAFLFTSNELVGITGMIGSLIIIGVIAKFSSHRR